MQKTMQLVTAEETRQYAAGSRRQLQRAISLTFFKRICCLTSYARVDINYCNWRLFINHAVTIPKGGAAAAATVAHTPSHSVACRRRAAQRGGLAA